MTNARALILEGPNGLSFFLYQTMLDDEVIGQVDVISRADQAVNLLLHFTYQLIIINLFEAPDQGLQLSLWLNQQAHYCPVILIAAPDDLPDLPFLKSHPFIVLPTSITLTNFSQCARLALTAYARP